MSERQRISERKAFVEICFRLIEADSVRDVARQTNLSESTIRRLIKGKITRRTWLGTVEKLGEAAGIRLNTDKDNLTVEWIQDK